LIIGSDRLQFDKDLAESDRIGGALFWLGLPQINYPHTMENLARLRRYLQGEDVLLEPNRPDA
jgi:hypothetical protein